MNPDFKLNYDLMKDNAESDSSDAIVDPTTDLYPSASNTRTLCLAWPDGRRMFLNYAYLISGEYSTEANTITLIFTTHNVVIRGNKLKELFEAFTLQIPQRIVEADPRYEVIDYELFHTIAQILVEKF